jgi:hypothetical protein
VRGLDSAVLEQRLEEAAQHHAVPQVHEQVLHLRPLCAQLRVDPLGEDALRTTPPSALNLHQRQLLLYLLRHLPVVNLAAHFHRLCVLPRAARGAVRKGVRTFGKTKRSQKRCRRLRKQLPEAPPRNRLQHGPPTLFSLNSVCAPFGGACLEVGWMGESPRATCAGTARASLFWFLFSPSLVWQAGAVEAQSA